MSKAVIVHCWEGSPTYCWYPWVQSRLTERGWEVDVPAMPRPNAPDLSRWLSTLQKHIGAPTADLFLVGHSIGCATILRYLEALEEEVMVGGVVLVAGFTDDLGYNELRSFFLAHFDFLRIQGRTNHTVAIHSDDDPFVPLQFAKVFQEQLKASIIVKHAMKHFSGPVDGEESCTELPEVVESLFSMGKDNAKHS